MSDGWLQAFNTLFDLAELGTAYKEDASYEDKLNAYNKEMERINKENRRKAERAQRQRQLMSAIGSDVRMMQPFSEETNIKPPKHDSTSSDAMAIGQALFGSISDIAKQFDDPEQPQSTASLSDVPAVGGSRQVDINQSAAPSSQPLAYNYTDRYEPRKRYLTQGSA